VPNAIACGILCSMTCINMPAALSILHCIPLDRGEEFADLFKVLLLERCSAAYHCGRSTFDAEIAVLMKRFGDSTRRAGPESHILPLACSAQEHMRFIYSSVPLFVDADSVGAVKEMILRESVTAGCCHPRFYTVK